MAVATVWWIRVEPRLKEDSQTSFTITWTAVVTPRVHGQRHSPSGTTPEAVFTGLTASTAYKVTVTATGDDNYVNSTASNEFDASTAADTAPAFADSATIADKTFTVDGEITAFTLPEASGGNGTISYALTPDLPTGLSLNESTREVSGTPTAAAAQATYTWRASDSDANTANTDSDTLTFMLTVNKATLAAPTGLALKEDSQTSTGFTITWTAVSNAAGYTASAMRADGTGMAVAGMVDTSGTTPEAVFTGLTASTAYKVTVTATGDDNYVNSTASNEFDASTAAPLPGICGRTEAVRTAILSGTPTAAAAQATYTWRASDSDANTANTDSDTLTFMLTVNKDAGGTDGSGAQGGQPDEYGLHHHLDAVSNAAGYTASAMRADGTGMAVAHHRHTTR